jgi:hypothetical protein
MGGVSRGNFDAVNGKQMTANVYLYALIILQRSGEGMADQGARGSGVSHYFPTVPQDAASPKTAENLPEALQNATNSSI